MGYLKRVVILVIALAVLFVLFMVGYRVVKSQGITESYAINPEVTFPKLLIATQKSKFKDSVMKMVLTDLATRPIHTQVIDVTLLSSCTPSDWDGFVIFTTVESGQIHPEAETFLKHKQNFSNVYLINTADSGQWKLKSLDIDAKTSASLKENINVYATDIISGISRMPGFSH